MSRTLLLRKSSLGDVVLLGAVIGALDGPITVYTGRRYVPLVRRMKGVHEVKRWPRSGESLPEGHIVDLQGSRRSRALCRGRPHSTIRKRSVARQIRVWWGGEGPVRPTVPELYAEACGLPKPAKPPWFPFPPMRRDTLVLVPGAAWKPKQWHVDRFGGVGRAWEGPVVVLGGPGEDQLCRAVSRQVAGAEVLVEDGFERTLELMGRASVVVSGDTGLLHLAGACGARVVALFGPTHPDDGFFVYDGEVVQRDLGCRPCTLHRLVECPLGDHACMDFGADRVIEAVERQCATSS